jgi:DNA repair protein RecO (recombination protein O)
MKWTDEGIVLAIAPFSEDQLRLSLLTINHGRQTGLFKQSKRLAVLQIGDFVSATWNARLSEHLGRFQIERTDSPAPRMFGDSWRLWLLQNACGLMPTLPERHPYPLIFNELQMFIERLTTNSVDIAFTCMTLLEKCILSELGFGIDLSECCVTQSQQDLTYISPKTGRAVSQKAAEPYKDKLLPLPVCWLNSTAIPSEELKWKDITNAFQVTQHFWHKWLFDDKHTFPPVRGSIMRYCERKGSIAHPL